VSRWAATDFYSAASDFSDRRLLRRRVRKNFIFNDTTLLMRTPGYFELLTPELGDV